MPATLLHLSCQCHVVELLLSADSDPVLLKPNGREPGRVVHAQPPHVFPVLAGPGDMAQVILDRIK